MRQRLKKWNVVALRIAKLERDIQIREEAYHEYATNMEKARIDHALQTERITNINVVQPATCEVLPIRPNTRLHLAFGLAAALVGTVGIALFFEQLQSVTGNFPSDQPRQEPPSKQPPEQPLQDHSVNTLHQMPLPGNHASPLPYPAYPPGIHPMHR